MHQFENITALIIAASQDLVKASVIKTVGLHTYTRKSTEIQ